MSNEHSDPSHSEAEPTDTLNTTTPIKKENPLSKAAASLQGLYEALDTLPPQELAAITLRQTKETTSKLLEARKAISPEHQYAFSVLSVYIFLLVLLKPESVPYEFKPLMDYLNTTNNRESVWFTVAFGFLGSVDGARRIALERLPFYKAMIAAWFYLDWD